MAVVMKIGYFLLVEMEDQLVRLIAFFRQKV